MNKNYLLLNPGKWSVGIGITNKLLNWKTTKTLHYEEEIRFTNIFEGKVYKYFSGVHYFWYKKSKKWCCRWRYENKGLTILRGERSRRQKLVKIYFQSYYTPGHDQRNCNNLQAACCCYLKDRNRYLYIVNAWNNKSELWNKKNFKQTKSFYLSRIINIKKILEVKRYHIKIVDRMCSFKPK